MNQGYAQQKRITGQQKTYIWQNPGAAPAPYRRAGAVHERAGEGTRIVSRRDARQAKKRYEDLMNRLAMYLLIICVVFGVFMVIGKLSQVSAQNSTNEKLTSEIQSLDETLVGKKQELEHESSAAVIEHRAKYELGMRDADANEIAYLSTVTISTNAAVQTAEGSVSSR